MFFYPYTLGRAVGLHMNCGWVWKLPATD